MLKRFSPFLAFILIFLTLIFFQIRAQMLPENPVEGFRIFIDKGCARCHAIWGEGETVGPDLGKVKLEGSFLDLAGIIWNHFPYMKEKMGKVRVGWHQFSSAELTSLITFLYFIDFFDEPGDPVEGERLFSLKGCINCHSIKGKGGKLGPSLDKFKEETSCIILAQTMWNHVPEMASTLGGVNGYWPEIKPTEMIDILAYLRRTSEKETSKPTYLLPGNPRRGKELFEEKLCSRCHSIWGEGGKVAPDLGKKAKELHRSFTQIVATMWNHAPFIMKKAKELNIPFPTCSAENEMADIIAYLYFLSYFDPPGNWGSGEKLFVAKGCINCHAFGERTKAIGPDLSRIKEFTTSSEIAAEMLNHAPAINVKVKEIGVSWPRFNPGEMNDLLEYLEHKRKEKIR